MVNFLRFSSHNVYLLLLYWAAYPYCVSKEEKSQVPMYCFPVSTVLNSVKARLVLAF